MHEITSVVSINGTAKNPSLSEGNETVSWLDQVGLKEVSLPFPQKDKYHTRHHFVTNNPGVYVRFHIPNIDERQKLKVSPIVRIEEYFAGLSPTFGIIPEKVQSKIEKAVQSGLPFGFTAKIDGVIIPRVTNNVLFDSFGLGKILDSPNISIHIYNAQNEFVEEEVLHFISKRDQKRILDINKSIEQMSPLERELYLHRFEKLFELFEWEGVYERLIRNPNSLGDIAVRKGFDLIDLHEICLQFSNERQLLEEFEESPYIKRLSPEQIKILRKRRQAYEQGQDIENARFYPSETNVIQKAIKTARDFGESIEFIEQLKLQLRERNDGLVRYQHNIARGGFLRKTGAKIKGGFLHYFDLLKRILPSGELIPREATYSKGTYLQKVDLRLDNPENLKRFVLYAMDPSEKLKNIRVKPIILDIVGRPIPNFKHQENSVKYVITDLRTNLKRIIVDDLESKKTVESILKDAHYSGVVVIDLEQWQREISYLQNARKELMGDLLLQ